MEAVVIRDGALVWAQRDDPLVGETDLLVAVRAAGVNAADLLQRRGRYPAPRDVEADIPGLELAGEVIGRGSKTSRFALGDRVMAVVGGGAQATVARVEETHVLRVPEALSWAEAGGFPEAFSTAFDALWTQCELQMGERVLITGAAGGVGTAAVQLAHASGALVVACARNPERHPGLLALGVDAAIVPEDIPRYGPYDVVLELVGAASLPIALDALAPGGRIAVIGVGSGPRVELDLLTLMGRRARIHGSTLRSRSREEKAAVAAAVAHHVLPLLDAGRISVPVEATFLLEDASLAYERFERGGKFGKVVLVA
jgi:NADPH:quinone reductase-like Zn-dependent oxidoreductase